MLDNYTVTQKTDELKKLILENPELPIVVLAGEEANAGYFGWMYCSCISFGISELSLLQNLMPIICSAV